MNLNVLTKVKWTKQDKTIVQASHSPLETILLEHKNSEVIASPSKVTIKGELRKVVEQNNYTNQCFNIIGSQLDTTENKIDTKNQDHKYENPLMKLPDNRQGFNLKFIEVFFFFFFFLRIQVQRVKSH